MTCYPVAEHGGTGRPPAGAVGHVRSGGRGRGVGSEPGPAPRARRRHRQAGTETRSLLGEAVTSARAAGASWDAIGRVLGMSRQAAHQRFGRPRDQDDTPGTPHPRPGHRVLRDGGPAGRRPSRLALGGLRRIPAHPRAARDPVGAPPDPRRGDRDAHPPGGGGLAGHRDLVPLGLPQARHRYAGPPGADASIPPAEPGPARTGKPLRNMPETGWSYDRPVADLFEDYRLGTSWDEMLGSPDEARGPYRAVHHTLRSMEPEVLRERAEYLARSFLDQGVTFDIARRGAPVPARHRPAGHRGRRVGGRRGGRRAAGAGARGVPRRRLERRRAGCFDDGVVPRQLVTSSAHFHRARPRHRPAERRPRPRLRHRPDPRRGRRRSGCSRTTSGCRPASAT